MTDATKSLWTLEKMPQASTAIHSVAKRTKYNADTHTTHNFNQNTDKKEGEMNKGALVTLTTRKQLSKPKKLTFAYKGICDGQTHFHKHLCYFVRHTHEEAFDPIWKEVTW